MATTYDVIILGSGPAGLTSAIYTSRANLNVLLFEGMQPGGQLTITNDVENFPSHPDGIAGPVLMDEIKKQALKFGTTILTETIDSVDFSKRPFTVINQDGVSYTAKSIIVSTGATAKTLEIPSEKTYWGAGISSCATCDGFFYRNKDVIVVGAGDTAMEDSLYLANLAKSVTIVHRRQGFRASKIMIDRAKAHPKISFILDSVIEEYVGEIQNNVQSLIGVKLKNVLTGEITDKTIDGVFLAIGHTPNTNIFKGILDMNEEGYLITKDKSSYTNIEGVFACGDVQDPTYKQAISAAGSGCIAGIDAERWLGANN
ncbi:MAG: thioredoxin-disulfide reductase [Ignavibacteria bacterium]|jgi:thioredoxin reductase (NADPH)|nr:thioredoxin-disulfide reductase [Ignavibacteria bacterium]